MKTDYFGIGQRVGIAVGVITMIVGAIIRWHMEEAACQKLHNVYDCEWTQSPFTPTAKDARQ